MATARPIRCLELSPDILNPGNTQIVMGGTRRTYTGTRVDADRKLQEDIDSTRSDMTQLIGGVIQTTHDQITSLQQNVNSIVLAALEGYVQTGDFGQYKEQVSTKLALLSDQLAIDITRISDRVDNVDGDLQRKYSEISKAFHFTSDGLIIGETGNEILLRLDNDVLQFVRNNTPELQITAEGVEALRVRVSYLIVGNVIHAADDMRRRGRVLRGHMAVSQSLAVDQIGQSVEGNYSTVRIRWTSTQTGSSRNGFTRTAYYYISINGGAEQEYTVSYTLPGQHHTGNPRHHHHRPAQCRRHRHRRGTHVDGYRHLCRRSPHEQDG